MSQDGAFCHCIARDMGRRAVGVFALSMSQRTTHEPGDRPGSSNSITVGDAWLSVFSCLPFLSSPNGELP
jgi:hypothetical protein